MHWDFNGEDGIRTHVTVKSNGFQDRRVMTASLPLLVSAYIEYHNIPKLSSSFLIKFD